MFSYKTDRLYSSAVAGVGVLISCIYGGANTDQCQQALKQEPKAPTIVSFVNDTRADMKEKEISDVLHKSLEQSQKAKAPRLAKLILNLSARYHLSPSIVLAVIKAESSFRVGITSYAGAMGLMQLRPTTARYIAEKYHLKFENDEDLYHPETNITLGIAYIHYLRSRFKDSIQYVAAYNMGPTSMSSQLSAKKFRLGKLEKYVTEIHSAAVQMRSLSQSSIYAAN